MSEPKRSNRLIHEKSPYLLQHSRNPVDWYPWGEEAFKKAHDQDKPVFLSIGYATCHWCHVMAHESFENEEAAARLNDAFICIKVDREERPDIDEVYMTACQMLGSRGGWPLTIVMTPDKRPFFAATYIPLETRSGHLGLLDLIPRISSLWKNQRADTLRSAERITEMLGEPGETNERPDAELLTRAQQESEEAFDSEYGGFGPAPKFPSAHRLLFLMRQNPETARPMVEKTLTAMRLGGIWDHIGSGIHRYSTDRKWLVPHFEKMLCDQAMTALACCEAFEAYGDALYRGMAEEIFGYVLRDMTAPDGGFYSAEDADSEGAEGKFYVWSVDELQAVLPPDELTLAVRLFNVQTNGNFRDEATRRQTGANILHLNELPEDRTALETIRRKLFFAREQRIHPLKDTKVLADWNGLMIAALAKAARVFNLPEYETAAQCAAGFIWNKMQQDGRLLHRWRDGKTAVPGQLADYAFFILGLLELYETNFDFQLLEQALLLNKTVLAHFPDKLRGGFYLTADDAETLITRPKSIYDGSIPSGNSIQMMNLLRLARLTGHTEYETLADQTLRSFSSILNRMPSGFTQALQALQFLQGGACDIVIAGDRDLPDTQAMIRAVRSVYQPNRTVILKEPGCTDVETIAPFTADMTAVNGKCAVYICRDFSCEQPLTDPQAVRAALQKSLSAD
jgi:hypothetical protein